MFSMQNATPTAIAVLVLELAPAVAFGCASDRVARVIARRPAQLRVLLPAALVLPYVLIAASQHMFRWQWFGLYAALPLVMAWLMTQAAAADPEQRGNWRDALILLTLGLAVDLRWFDVAWPDGWRGLGNLLLVDAGLYAFLGIRDLNGDGIQFPSSLERTGRQACANSPSSHPRCSCSESLSASFIRTRIFPR